MEFCKVINNKNIILIGIHWNTGIKNKQRISQFMKSLKKLVNEDKKILIFGDTNANPDIRYENCVEKNEEFLNNCIFEWFIGSNQHIAADVNAVVVHESAVHVDNHLVADENMLSVFAMEINVHMHSLSHAAEHLAQQGLFALCVGIICGVELCQQPPCAQNCLYYLRVFPSNERFARHAFFVFCFHKSCVF